MVCVPASELASRTLKLQNLLKESKIDGVLLLQSADLVYFTGTYQSGYLYIAAEDEPLFMVRRSVHRAKEHSALKRIVPLHSPKLLGETLKKEGCKTPGYKTPLRLGLELDVLPAGQYLQLQKIFHDSEIVDCSKIIKQVRAIKSDYELNLIKKTAAMMDQVFAAIPSVLRVGMTELELAANIESLARQKGHQGLVRARGFNMSDFHFGCVLSGEHGGVASFFDGPLGGPGLSPAFPFGVGNRTLFRNEPVVVDYVGALAGYLVDMTRVFVIGDLTEHLKQAHQVALQIQKALVKQAVPGANGEELYQLSLDIADQAQIGKHFMGCGEQVSFVAHGVGLELNELPILARGAKNTILEAGMILAVEPKFIFPGEGAVGIENTFVITSEGLECLTKYPDGIKYI